MDRLITLAGMLLIVSVIAVMPGCGDSGHMESGEMEEHHDDMSAEHMGGMDDGHMDTGHMDGEHAGEMAEHGMSMEDQHESMRRLLTEWERAKAGIESGETGKVAEAAEEMDRAAALQQEFMLHKKPESREEFMRKATDFRRMVMGLKVYAEKDDVKSLREVAPQIDAACNDCHGEFR